MRKGLILVSLLGWMAAGCGGSSKSGGNGGGGGSAGGGGGAGGGTGVSTDMAQPAPPDLLTPADLKQLACSDLLSDSCQASQAAFDACTANATTKAKSLYNAVSTCVSGKCSGLTTDAGSGMCSTQQTCSACVQTGTSPTGVVSEVFATCTDDGQDTATGNALCGVCVDQINGCIDDV